MKVVCYLCEKYKDENEVVFVEIPPPIDEGVFLCRKCNILNSTNPNIVRRKYFEHQLEEMTMYDSPNTF